MCLVTAAKRNRMLEAIEREFEGYFHITSANFLAESESIQIHQVDILSSVKCSYLQLLQKVLKSYRLMIQPKARMMMNTVKILPLNTF